MRHWDYFGIVEGLTKINIIQTSVAFILLKKLIKLEYFQFFINKPPLNIGKVAKYEKNLTSYRRIEIKVFTSIT